jgi:fatty acid desaturase
MKKNMGSADRIIRVMLAALVVLLYFMKMISGTTAVILLVLAAVFILTSLVSFCPLYLPFGLSTLRKKIHAKN